MSWCEGRGERVYCGGLFVSALLHTMECYRYHTFMDKLPEFSSTLLDNAANVVLF